MKGHFSSSQVPAHITIRVSGKLFRGHLTAIDQLVQSAAECNLWPLLSLAELEAHERIKCQPEEESHIPGSDKAQHLKTQFEAPVQHCVRESHDIVSSLKKLTKFCESN